METELVAAVEIGGLESPDTVVETGGQERLDSGVIWCHLVSPRVIRMVERTDWIQC